MLTLTRVNFKGKGNVFGELPNPDPMDESPIEKQQGSVHLVNNNQKIQLQYSKGSKQQILANAISLSWKDMFLGKKVSGQAEKAYSQF